MAWATEEDVQGYTGRTASPESLALAQSMVEDFSGTTVLASTNELISTRNLRLLSKAVAYQAVWLDSHPDVLDGMDVNGISQDGLSASYQHANAALLAPMAKRCIDRLSWKLRPLKARKSPRYDESGNRDSAIADDQHTWTPMRG